MLVANLQLVLRVGLKHVLIHPHRHIIGFKRHRLAVDLDALHFALGKIAAQRLILRGKAEANANGSLKRRIRLGQIQIQGVADIGNLFFPQFRFRLL